MIPALNLINRTRREQRKREVRKDIDADLARRYLSVHGIRLEDLDGVNLRSGTRFRDLSVSPGLGYNGKPMLEIRGEYYYSKSGRVLDIDEREGVPFNVKKPFRYGIDGG